MFFFSRYNSSVSHLVRNLHLNVWANHEPTEAELMLLSRDRWRIIPIPEFTPRQTAKIEAEALKRLAHLNIVEFPSLIVEDSESEDEAEITEVD